MPKYGDTIELCQNKKLGPGPNRLCGEDCLPCDQRSFRTHEKARYWSIKNKTPPRHISLNSGKKFIFDCPVCLHEFESVIDSITRNSAWCPYCANKRRCSEQTCDPCFQKSFQSHPQSAFWSTKNTMAPRDVAKSSHKKFWFDCPSCPHEFEASLDSIKIGRFCPFCANRKLCTDIECTSCYNKSYASNPLSLSWSPNNDLTPRQVARNSHETHLFNCKQCSHEYKSAPSNDTGCPYCSHQKMCYEASCKFCFEASFASQEGAKSLHADNKVDPRTIFKHSKIKLLFVCGKCPHSFWSSPTRVSVGWCVYCVNRKLCEDGDCQFCYDKSMASSHRAKSWSPRNELIARAVFRFSNDKYLFYCMKCNLDFSASPAHINAARSWCPTCKHKTEKKLMLWLQANSFVFQPQQSFTWTKTRLSTRRYDFCLSELIIPILIELDGPQHFRQISNWQSHEITRLADQEKNALALEHGYHMIRICQEVVLYDKENWEETLLAKIQDLMNKIEPQLSYIGEVYTNYGISNAQ